MGTFRAMDEAWRFEAHDIIRTISENLVKSMGGELDLHIDVGYPTVFNNEALTSAYPKAMEFTGPSKVEETEIRMGAEDLDTIRKIPDAFTGLG